MVHGPAAPGIPGAGQKYRMCRCIAPPSGNLRCHRTPGLLCSLPAAFLHRLWPPPRGGGSPPRPRASGSLCAQGRVTTPQGAAQYDLLEDSLRKPASFAGVRTCTWRGFPVLASINKPPRDPSSLCLAGLHSFLGTRTRRQSSPPHPCPPPLRDRVTPRPVGLTWLSARPHAGLVPTPGARRPASAPASGWRLPS